MLQSLLGTLVELVLSAAWSAAVRLFGVENLVEITSAILGLSCIAIGFAVLLLDH